MSCISRMSRAFSCPRQDQARLHSPAFSPWWLNLSGNICIIRLKFFPNSSGYQNESTPSFSLYLWPVFSGGLKLVFYIKTNCERGLLRKMGSKPGMNGHIFWVVVKMAFKTFLCHFVHGHETWADYLTYMEQDGARGDHLILCATANCFETCIWNLEKLWRN